MDLKEHRSRRAVEHGEVEREYGSAKGKRNGMEDSNWERGGPALHIRARENIYERTYIAAPRKTQNAERHVWGITEEQGEQGGRERSAARA